MVIFNMSDVWRQKGLKLLPELESDFNDEEFTPYLALTEVKNIALTALKSNKNHLVEKCFEYAEWCFRQDEEDLWNAAGICFYEYIYDQDEVLEKVVEIVSIEIFEDIKGLLEQRYSGDRSEKYVRINSYYEAKRSKLKSKC